MNARTQHHLVHAVSAGGEPLWDVRTPTGEILLAGVTHCCATWAANEYQARPECATDIWIRRRRGDDVSPESGRHDGPLVLRHHSLGWAVFPLVDVRSHVGGCVMELEEALRRIDQFSTHHQAILMAGLRQHYDMGPDYLIRQRSAA